MEIREEILVCLAIAAASNCSSCFEHYHKEALRVGITKGDIAESVGLANKIQNGCKIIMANRIKEISGEQEDQKTSCCSDTGSSCS